MPGFVARIVEVFESRSGRYIDSSLDTTVDTLDTILMILFELSPRIQGTTQASHLTCSLPGRGALLCIGKN